MDYLLLLAGLAFLIAGGEFLVRGAAAIAIKAKISPLVVGMTVVSFGTSAPELLVSIKAAIDGYPDLAIGNVIGSNISNLALVLGCTGLLIAVPIVRSTLRYDWPVMMLSAIAFYLFAWNGKLERWECGLLILGLIIFLVWRIRVSRKNESDTNTEEVSSTGTGKSILFLAAGCVALYFGADWLVKGAVNIATSFGISQHVIAVSIVAVGTSVPELVTSVVAAIRKQLDISIGNLIGSNIFNIMAVLGITGVIKEIPVSSQVMNSDVFWMLAISFAILPLMLIRRKIGRIEGILLLASYATYIWLLF